jgi:hypothetical protein
MPVHSYCLADIHRQRRRAFELEETLFIPRSATCLPAPQHRPIALCFYARLMISLPAALDENRCRYLGSRPILPLFPKSAFRPVKGTPELRLCPNTKRYFTRHGGGLGFSAKENPFQVRFSYPQIQLNALSNLSPQRLGSSSSPLTHTL